MAENREPVFANPKNGAKFAYGFQSANGGNTTLGVVKLVEGTAPPKDVVFSPKNVKLPMAFKTGVVAKGGLCDFAKTDLLKAAGYVITRKKASKPKAGPKSVIVGTRLAANVVLTWRYPKTKWDLIPAAIKTAAGVALASTFTESEHAFHPNGFVFIADKADINVEKGVYYPIKYFKSTFSDATKSYSIYSGNPGISVTTS